MRNSLFSYDDIFYFGYFNNKATKIVKAIISSKESTFLIL